MRKNEYGVNLDISDEEEEEKYDEDLIRWKSVGHPMDGTWKCFARHQIFLRYLEISKNYHNEFQLNIAINTMTAMRTLSFSLILKSDEDTIHMDICMVIVNNVYNLSQELLKRYEIERQVDRYEHQQRRLYYSYKFIKIN